MKKASFLGIICLLFFTCSCMKGTVQLEVVATSDLHGILNEPTARISGYIRQLQGRIGKDNLLLFDCGDILQGTPVMYYSNFVADPTEKHVCAAFYDWFPYTATTVGNHDIEAGQKVFDRIYAQTKVPVVCANVLSKVTREPYFTPYMIVKRQGYKIAVLGLTTPYVGTWIAERLRVGLEFQTIEAAALKWVKHINKTENPDVIIALIHSGLNGGKSSDELGLENAVEWVASNVPGIQLICYGHDHKPNVEQYQNKEGEAVWVMNPGDRGNTVAKAEIRLQSRKKPHVTVSAKLLDTRDWSVDSDYGNTLGKYFAQAEAYEKTPIAVIENQISSDDALKGPSGWVDEVHRGQLDMAGLGTDILPEISFVAPLASHKTIGPGILYLSDFFSWFPYENSLCVVRMTGEEVVRYLDYSAGLRNSSLGFDSAAGIKYEIYPNEPAGKRVRVFSMANGTPFKLDRSYNVAINSYRSMGGGGHLSEGLGWTSRQIKNGVIWESKEDIRTMFMKWEKSRTPFTASPLDQWKMVVNP